jgi:threonylcarbamoyladenosine tRNA methylthiotransferase MtaB
VKVFFSNLGCKLNQAEVDRLARQFVAAGHRLAPALEEADLHVVNSCTVTHLAGRDSRKEARRGKRAGARVVLTGCHATSAPEEAAALGIDLVLPNAEKESLLERVHQAFPELAPPAIEGEPLPYLPVEVGHQRALVKIEDGCNMGCAFCIIPSTRGRQRSRPPAEILAEVQALAGAGFAEIVLTGVQISEYLGGETRLYDLVSQLLERSEARRLRLTSIAPWRFDERLLELYAHPRVCRHIHMSLQSGSTATLRRMRRPYSAGRYAGLASRLRQAVPGIAITTDIIVGFPGESEKEHQESLAFAAEMGFAKTHVFTYSPRPGTVAAGLPGEVPPAEAKRRVHQHLEVAAASERNFAEAALGRRLEVVWDQQRQDDWTTGLADTALRVYCREKAPAGALEEVELTSIVDGRPVVARLKILKARHRAA